MVVAPFNQLVVRLVEIGEQATVAAGHASGVWIRFESLGSLLEGPLEAFPFEMHNGEGFTSDGIEAAILINEARERSRAAFDGLVEEKRLPIFSARSRFGEDLAFLQLEDRFDATSQRMLDGRHDGIPLAAKLCQPGFGESDEQRVLSVFHDGRDSLAHL